MLSDFSRNHFFASRDRTSDLFRVFCHRAVESALDRNSDRDYLVRLSSLCLVGNAIQIMEMHSRRVVMFFISPA